MSGQQTAITVTLRCGTVLEYETPGFRPARGDVVPCRRHGYCTVSATGGPERTEFQRRRSRSPGPQDLAEWLQDRHGASVHALRARGFTLRIVAAAAREGLVDLDIGAGRVTLRPTSPDVLDRDRDHRAAS